MNSTKRAPSAKRRTKDVLVEVFGRYKKLLLMPTFQPGRAGRIAGWVLLLVGITLLVYIDDADEKIRDLGLATATMAWAKLTLVSAAGTLLIAATHFLTRSILPVLLVAIVGMWTIVSSDIFTEADVVDPLAKHGTSESELRLVTMETFDARLIRSYPKRIEASPIGPNWRATSQSEHPHNRGLPTFLEADDKLRQVTEEKLNDLKGKILSLPVERKIKETVDQVRKGMPNAE